MNYIISHFRLRCFIALFSFCWLSVAVNAAEPLLWKFVEGDSYNYQMVQEMKTSMNLGPGGETTSSVKQIIDMVWNINSVDDDGTAAMTQAINRVQMNITAPGQGDVNFDTAEEEPAQGFAAMLAPSLKAMTKTPFKVTMTSRGEITNVEVPAALLESMSQGPGGTMLGSLATEKGFKDAITQNAVTLPLAEELVEGHQWSTSFEIENPVAGKVITETTYEYKGSRDVDGQQLEVFVPTLDTRFGEANLPNGTTLKVKSQETTGEILFSRSAGRLVSTSIHQLLDLEITVGGNVVNQHIDQTIKFRMTNDE